MWLQGPEDPTHPTGFYSLALKILRSHILHGKKVPVCGLLSHAGSKKSNLTTADLFGRAF